MKPLKKGEKKKEKKKVENNKIFGGGKGGTGVAYELGGTVGASRNGNGEVFFDAYYIIK